jgi:Zn-dependent protease with chaperone function
MQTIVKCDCQYKGNCKFVRKLHAAIYGLEDDYPSITEFDKIIVVRSRKKFWNELSDDGDSFLVSCGLLKNEFDDLQWALTRIYFNLGMNEYDDIENEDECVGDCQNDSIESCEDCHCGESCCRRCSGEEDDDRDNLTRAVDRLESVSKIKYPIEIVENSEINAYALPEGKIQITSAAVNNLSEEELAFIIGHEEAHIDKRHGKQKMDLAEQISNGVKEIAKDEEIGGFKKFVGIVAIGAATIAVAPLINKACELAADSEAKKRMTEAGYSEEDAAKFFDRIGEYRGKYFSTHPTPQFRKKIIKD